MINSDVMMCFKRETERDRELDRERGGQGVLRTQGMHQTCRLQSSALQRSRLDYWIQVLGKQYLQAVKDIRFWFLCFFSPQDAEDPSLLSLLGGLRPVPFPDLRRLLRAIHLASLHMVRMK